MVARIYLAAAYTEDGVLPAYVSDADAAKLEAIVRAADMLRREIEFAPCRDNEDHSLCLRCAAISAYDPVRGELK